MADSGQVDMQEVVIRTQGGTYHRAYHNLQTDTVLTPEGCNLDQAESVETFPQMPDEAEGLSLCLRCYPIGSDR